VEKPYYPKEDEQLTGILNIRSSNMPGIGKSVCRLNEVNHRFDWKIRYPVLVEESNSRSASEEAEERSNRIDIDSMDFCKSCISTQRKIASLDESRNPDRIQKRRHP